MKTKEYIAEVMSDGHLSLPEKVAKGLGLTPRAKVKVIIKKISSQKSGNRLSSEAKKKALAIKDYITDMGPEDLSENFREKYK